MQLFKNTYTFWTILIIANIAMYGLTILISYSWSKIKQHKTLKLTKKDIYNSILVLVINILVAIPGYLLFTKGYISFIKDSHFIVHFLMLYFGFDLLMYVLHIISHYVWPFNKFHAKHHSHQYFNAISLYVMEPVESLLFGLLLTAFAFFFSLNLYSFLAFIFLNWILGVIGHLNTTTTKQPLLFGNHVFHKTHHQYGNKNFGFYTVIWDRLFGTYYGNKN